MKDRQLTPSMSNTIAYRLGRISQEVGTQHDGIGDFIDRGLILLRRLNEEGFYVITDEPGDTDAHNHS